MNFRCFIYGLLLLSASHVGAQMALPPSNEGDDDGTLTPDFITFLTDSGRVDGNTKVGEWKEYLFSAFMSSRRREVRYDSMQHYDSLNRYLQFYKHEGGYVNGKKAGEWKTFVCYKKQLPLKWRLESKVNYYDGLRQGLEQVFGKQGQFVGRNFYRNDLRDSISTFYHRDDVVSTTIQYKNGKYHGRTIFYTDQGEIVFEMIYIEGKRIGSIVYSSNGSPPQIDGQYDLYFPDGKLKSSSQYTRGELDGVHKTFYSSGNPEKEMTFVRGALDGMFKEYYDNGLLKLECVYKDGKLWQAVHFATKKGKSLPAGTLKDGAGTLNIYNENGKLISTSHYKNGIVDRDDSGN